MARNQIPLFPLSPFLVALSSSRSSSLNLVNNHNGSIVRNYSTRRRKSEWRSPLSIDVLSTSPSLTARPIRFLNSTLFIQEVRFLLLDSQSDFFFFQTPHLPKCVGRCLDSDSIECPFRRRLRSLHHYPPRWARGMSTTSLASYATIYGRSGPYLCVCLLPDRGLGRYVKGQRAHTVLLHSGERYGHRCLGQRSACTFMSQPSSTVWSMWSRQLKLTRHAISSFNYHITCSPSRNDSWANGPNNKLVRRGEQNTFLPPTYLFSLYRPCSSMSFFLPFD